MDFKYFSGYFANARAVDTLVSPSQDLRSVKRQVARVANGEIPLRNSGEILKSLRNHVASRFNVN